MNLLGIPDTVWAALIGGAGTVVVYLLRWLLGRGIKTKQQEQSDARHQKQIDEASFKLAAELRDEMRRDNLDLRERQSASEARISDLVIDNQKLRTENMELMGKNGALLEKSETQAKQILTMQQMIAELQLDRQILVDALIRANIPLPIELYRKPKTGTVPLGQGDV